MLRPPECESQRDLYDILARGGREECELISTEGVVQFAGLAEPHTQQVHYSGGEKRASSTLLWDSACKAGYLWSLLAEANADRTAVSEIHDPASKLRRYAALLHCREVPSRTHESRAHKRCANLGTRLVRGYFVREQA